MVVLNAIHAIKNSHQYSGITKLSSPNKEHIKHFIVKIKFTVFNAKIVRVGVKAKFSSLNLGP